MKLRTESGRLAVSLTHVPGRGSGTFEFKTGSQAEFDVAWKRLKMVNSQTKIIQAQILTCSLNFPVMIEKYKSINLTF